MLNALEPRGSWAHEQEVARTPRWESLLSCGLFLPLSLKVAVSWAFSNAWYGDSAGWKGCVDRSVSSKGWSQAVCGSWHSI